MTNILVTSASHLFSDYLLSSEGIHCYNLFKNLNRYGYTFDIITPYAKVMNTLNNINIHQTGNIVISPDIGLRDKYNLHCKFLIRGYNLATKLLKKKKYNVKSLNSAFNSISSHSCLTQFTYFDFNFVSFRLQKFMTRRMQLQLKGQNSSMKKDSMFIEFTFINPVRLNEDYVEIKFYFDLFLNDGEYFVKKPYIGFEK